MARSGKRFKKLLDQARQRPQYWVSRITLDFANALNNLMQRQQISRKELARRIGSSPAYVTKVLHGDANYTVETMVKLAMAVDARVEVRLVEKNEQQWQPVDTRGDLQFMPLGINNTTVAASNDGQWQPLKVAG